MLPIGLTTSEAGLVPLVSGGDHFFGSINGLSALSTLGNVWGFERHDYYLVRFEGSWKTSVLVRDGIQDNE